MRFVAFLAAAAAATWLLLRRTTLKGHKPKPSGYAKTGTGTGFVHVPAAPDTPAASKASDSLSTGGVSSQLTASETRGIDPEAPASDSIGACAASATPAENTPESAPERLKRGAEHFSLSAGSEIAATGNELQAKPEADTPDSDRKALAEPVVAIEQVEPAAATEATTEEDLTLTDEREPAPPIEVAEPPAAAAEAEAPGRLAEVAAVTDEREPAPAIEVAEPPAEASAASISVAESSSGQNNGQSANIAVPDEILLHEDRKILAEPGPRPSGEPPTPDSKAVSSAQNGAANRFDTPQTLPQPDESKVATEAKVRSRAGKKSTDRRSVLRHGGKKKRFSVPKYQAPIRTPEILTSPRESRVPTTPDLVRTRALGIAVHVTIGRRNRYQVSLLPERSDGLPEAITVRGPRGVEEWNAQQEEWYADLIPTGLESILREGAQWEARGENGLRWTLARGREIYVLAARPENGVHGFVTTTRLLLNENQFVLCTKEQEPSVRYALSNAGCLNPRSFSEDAGIPLGWVLFTEVRPTAAVPHDTAAGIFNVLRPVHEVEIELRGGIRVERMKWLYGHPPQLRLRGDPDDLEVTIDQTIASRDALGSYAIQGWADVGIIHRVFCGGATASYEIVPPPTYWDLFTAFMYETIGLHSPAVTVCGPLVRAAGQHETILLHRRGRTCLLGAVPGEIAFVDPPLDARVPALLAAADFPIVWAIPAVPLLTNKEANTIQLVQHHSPEPLDGSRKPRLKLWAQLVMDAVYKRLRIEPDTDDARRLWAEYKRAARQMKRELL